MTRALLTALVVVLAVAGTATAGDAEEDGPGGPGDNVAAAMAAARRAAAKAIEEDRRRDEFGLKPEEPEDRDLALPDPLLDRTWPGPKPGEGDGRSTRVASDEEDLEPLPRDPELDAAGPPDLPRGARGGNGGAPGGAANAGEEEERDGEDDAAGGDQPSLPFGDRVYQPENDRDDLGLERRYDPTRDPVDTPDGDIYDGDLPDDDTPFSDVGEY